VTDFGGLSVALSGLNAHRKRIDVIGDNIANINTPGYHRQRVSLSPVDHVSSGLFAGWSKQGGGVDASSVDRMRDRVLSGHARVQAGVAADRGTTADVLQQMELIVGGLDPGGIHDQMNAMFNSFDDLAAAPEDPAMRQVVLQRAQGLAQAFNRTVANVDELQDRMALEAADSVSSINLLSEQIAVLDAEILGSSNFGDDPNTLLDRRDTLVADMTTLADVDVVENPNGQVAISLDGHLLVSNGSASLVSLEPKPDLDLATLGYDKFVVVNSSGRELNVKSGELAGQLNSLAQTIPDGKKAIDAVSAGLVDQVNAIHQGGAGLDGSTGLNLFETGPGLGEIQISADVVDQPEKVGAAVAGAGALDEANARALAQLAETAGGPLSLFGQMVGTLAAKVVTATGGAEAASAAAEQASNMAISAGGVSLDEELTDLITAQRAYEASARFMTAIDEMLQTLVSSTGRVGR